MGLLHGRPDHIRVQHDLPEKIRATALGHPGDVEMRQAPEALRMSLCLQADQALLGHLLEGGEGPVGEAGEEVVPVGVQVRILSTEHGLVPARIEIVA